MKTARRCKLWLPRKNRFCANIPLHDSLYCGNHNPKLEAQRISCPLDPSHSIYRRKVKQHVKRCPFLKQPQSFKLLEPFFKKGINGGRDFEEEEESFGAGNIVTPRTKRQAMYEMTVIEFYELITKIEAAYASIATSSDIQESFKEPQACKIWMNQEVERKKSYREKQVQHASILGNLEEFGVLEDPTKLGCRTVSSDYAVVEFGAGRGYLSHALADCYGIRKADRRLRQKESMVLERLRVDIEDLDLKAIESLKGVPYLAVGNHLCGSAIDLILRCCLLPKQTTETRSGDTCNLRGLAVATCCHHLCQWKHYINKSYLSDLGINKDDFHVITSITNWDVCAAPGKSIEKKSCNKGVKEIIHGMTEPEMAALRSKCKAIIDMGRLMWVKQLGGFTADIVKYVPSSISRENNLLVAKYMQ
ncbi:hypothetical protein MKW94_030693 [Papaver nudicaule]|uniref:tRNA:m(4)X modification enzyme TRM13 n=1 Tax=Papaver nudicaule TaxID=74823 RepID=A0AA42AYP1_PAPNU|nr:hypothetical protein [Papaver nudicaule]